jgi:hypothetical protein
MTVPVNFDRGAVRSGIRQISNVIIFHLWSLLWKAIAGLKWSNGILLGAFSIIRRWFRHYMRCFCHYTRWFESIIRGAFAIIPGAFTINIRGAFTILIYAVVSQLYAVVQALYAVLLFNIISIFFPCIWFHDCLNLVCGWQCFLVFASGLQWQWHALQRFIYVLCEFYILSYSVDLLVINLCIYKWI